MQTRTSSFVQFRQCASVARPRPTSRSVRCFAKRKGEQKNEGMYFVYQDVPKHSGSAGGKSSEKQKQEFSWVGSARSSVQQYKQAQGRPSKLKQQQQQKSQRQEVQAASTVDSEYNLDLRISQQGNPADDAVVEVSAAAATSAAATAGAQGPPTQQQQQQQEAPETTVSSSSSNDPTGLPGSATSTVQTPSSSSSSSSSKQDVVTKRKQQLLQRMKGSAPSSPSPLAAAAASTVATSAAAAAAAAEEDMSPTDDAVPGLDAEGEALLQELLDMAQQLSDQEYNTITDNDPSADPLADVMPDFAPSSSSSSNEISLADLSAAADAGDAEAAEWFATITELQQKMQSAAAAADVVGDVEDSSSVLRAADLLNWEAEEARRNNTVTDLDVDAELVATEQADYGELPDGDEEDEWEYIEDDEDQGEVDESTFENDAEVQQMLAADEAEFARMLAQLNDMPGSSSSSGDREGANSSSAAAAAAEEEDAWQGMQLEDWLQAVSDDQDDLGGGDDDGAEISALLGDASLSDVLGAIESDQSLDDKAKLEARLRIQGMFNDPTTAAAGSSRRGSRERKQQVDDDQPVVKPSTSGDAASSSAAAADGGDDGAAEEPVLMPRPVWRP